MRYRIKLLLLGCCALPLAAAGQQSSLDLRTTLATAEAQNLELRAARQQRAVALAGITTARQLPNPNLSFSVARDTPHEGIMWDQPLELGGKRGKRIALAREEQATTELDIALLARQIRRRTREAFFKALAAREQTVQAKAALDLVTRTREAVQQRFEAGDVAQLEVIQADVELARASADYELTAQAQRSADALLAGLLNRPLTSAPDITGSLDAIPSVESLDTVTQQALTSNADILKTSQDLKVEERRLALAKSERIPNISIQAGADFNSPPEFNIGPKGGIAVTLPLLYRGQGEVALATARLELLRLVLQSQRTSASAEIAATYYDYVAKLHQTQRYANNIVPQTLRLAQMAEESYRAGKTNLLTLIDAQRKLNDVRKTYLDSLLAAQSAFAVLEELVGAPLD